MTAHPMDITPPFPDPDTGPIFARQVLAAAAEVEEAEQRIKRAIRAAAERGDTGDIIGILARWDTLPAAEVLEGHALLDVADPR